MKTVLFTDVETIDVVTVADPSPGPREAIVAPSAVGLCGTDLHLLEGDLARQWPTVPGHEFAGTVVAVGDAVTELRIGDRVAVDPSLYCGECYFCRRGRGNQCERWGSLGVTRPGAAAELVSAPAPNCVILPDHIDTKDAALIEPLACAVRGIDVMRMAMADHVLIYGAGTMGLMLLELCKHAGASTVTVVDVNLGRLATARELGCTAAVSDPLEAERARGWDMVIDCTGVVSVIEAALGQVGRGGTYLQFGVAPKAAGARFSPFDVYNREISIVGSMAILHSFERAADLFAQGVIRAEQFVTHRYPIERYADAVATFRGGQGRKIQILPNGGSASADRTDGLLPPPG